MTANQTPPRVDEFVQENSTSFSFSNQDLSYRADLLSNIVDTLRARESANVENLLTALDAIRILSRDKLMLQDVTTESILCELAYHAGLLRDFEKLKNENLNPQTVLASLKCLYNLVMNSPQVQKFCGTKSALTSLLNRINNSYGLTYEIQLFDLRLIFLTTALNSASRKICALDLDAVRIFIRIIESQPNPTTDESCALICEALKILYNITLSISPWSTEYSAVEGSVVNLASLISDTLQVQFNTQENRLETSKHCINLVNNLPSHTIGSFVPDASPSADDPLAKTFEEHNAFSIEMILKYLEHCLECTTSSSLTETVLPVLTSLTRMARSCRIIRRYCKIRVLPPLGEDVLRLPQVGSSLRNKLCQLLTSINSPVKRVAAEFLFILCKENVSRLIKYTGFGNSAGLLSAYGLLGGHSNTSTDYSEDSDSDTEEYRELEPDINPVTGRVERERTNPLNEMTEEQMAYETHRLMDAMDRLQRIGVVQPSRIGADGRPEPVEHVLELLEAGDRESEGNTGEDGDGEQDD